MPLSESLADASRDDVRVDWISVEVCVPVVHELLLAEIQIHSVLELVQRPPLQEHTHSHEQCLCKNHTSSSDVEVQPTAANSAQY